MSPTNLTLDEIFKGVPVPAELEGVRIYDVNANAQARKMELTIFSDTLISYLPIEEFKRAAAEKYNLNELIIKVKYADLTIDEVDVGVYYENLVFYVNAIVPGVRHLFADSRSTYADGVMRIYCKYGTQMLEDRNISALLARLVNTQLGDTITVELIDESAENALSEMQQEMAAALAVEIPDVPAKKEEKSEPAGTDGAILGKPVTGDLVELRNISEDMGQVCVHGEMFDIDTRELKSGKILLTFCISDQTNSYSCKAFVDKKKFPSVKENIKDGAYIKLRGRIQYDTFARENVFMVNDISPDKKVLREDHAEEKRVELHMHTQMSAMDGMANVKDLVKTAARWGHKAVAVTDHGNVQAFPDAAKAAKDSGIKVIYGVECYLVSDSVPATINAKDYPMDGEFVVFDIETTGLSPVNDSITEIGAIKVSGGVEVDRFSTFVNPGRSIPAKIVELTGITDAMVADAPGIDAVLPDFYEFIGDAPLVAHNAGFDTSFIRAAANDAGMPFEFCYVDTLELARALVKDTKNHKLDTLCKHFEVSLENHHRATDDAAATAQVFVRLMNMAKERGADNLLHLNTALAGEVDIKNQRTYHAIILVQNYTGLRNLYEIISKSHLDYFYKRPRMPKSLIEQHREGLIIGSACEAGELYRAILENPKNVNYNEINKIIKFYDYLEIQPLGNNQFLIENGSVASQEDLKYINKMIIDFGKRNNKPTVATCDVHFLNPSDEVFRRILMAGQKFADADNQAPLYLRTTEEMLAEFDYLGEELAREVVIENTNKIADMIDELIPVPDETAPPIIEGSDDDLRNMTYGKAREIYGEELPELVRDRIDVELSSIIDNGYSVLYIIAQKLVSKSLSDGYLVGSRGSVGSSFVAFLSGITEVNSLPPHYSCPNCKRSDFILDGSVGCGFDMEDKVCPDCGTPMKKDGHDIPFETFLGFGGGKEPDIDLNFSGDYQPVAHKYTEELFGEGHVFRAGTIGTIAERTAFGYVKNYFEDRGQYVSNAEISRLVRGCTGVKRTTGQHPGGVMIVPRTRDIHEFCPIQHPADDKTSGIITTHFDYHSISGKLLKLDLLGHDDPTVIRMLEDLTGLDAKKIPFGDPETMSLFGSTEALGVTAEDINSEVGTYAVPEFGTRFVRQMLVDTKPTTFSELVRISGLSHGTDVWTGNAQELIRAGKTTLKNAICTRDDIMLYLIQMGVEAKLAFTIMESVRKGKGLKEDWEQTMRENNVPEWYIGSCKKIQYMFPKAHAVAYVTMAYRIAWFKVHRPHEFYATYFTVRADDFDAELMAQGRQKVQDAIRMYEAKGNDITAKEKGVLTILEVCNEMYARGIEFLPIDIFKSHATKFQIENGALIPPLNAISGLGSSAAQSIVEAREQEPFTSIADIIQRSKANKTVIETMRRSGALGNLPESSQMTFFDGMF
ncbi:MAG: PolC-type DNA polymerase III [Ruminococcaceae bacterium]|nr:PolC-type DNA polymerase III [Oscillospiraceae bacterium]